MRTLIHLELLRVIRDKRFWFWALLGVPVLLPAIVVILAFSFASLGAVQPETVKPVVATTATDEAFLLTLTESGLAPQVYSTREDVTAALTTGAFSVGLVDVALEPGQPMKATILTVGKAHQLAVFTKLESITEAFAVERRTLLVNELQFDGPSFDLLLTPMHVSVERLPSRIPSGVSQLTVFIWSALLLFPYLLLSWNSSSRIVTDRMSGYLSALNASALQPWRWLVARWLSLSVVGAALVVYSALIFALYMRAFGTLSDLLVAEGILTNLSEDAALTAQAYLVDAVALWRGTSWLSMFLWLGLALMQITTLCALIVWGSVSASSLAHSRVFELVPFTLVFLLPTMGLGLLGLGVGVQSMVPGLNTVLAIAPTISGSLPGLEFFSSAFVAILSNTVVAAFFLVLAMFSLRNEKLWAV